MSDEPIVFAGLTQRQIDAVQPGPCVICGDTNYPLSFGGPSVCGPCDCGTPPEVTRLRRKNFELGQQNIDLMLALTKALGLRGIVTPQMDEIADGVIAKFRAQEPKA